MPADGLLADWFWSGGGLLWVLDTVTAVLAFGRRQADVMAGRARIRPAGVGLDRRGRRTGRGEEGVE
jgi:hypothetical protein